MRVLFIYPNLNAQIGFNYGISYMSSVLKERGVETFLLNVNERLGYSLDLSAIKKDVLRIRPDYVGISTTTNQYKYALKIASDIKSYYDVPIIMGGIHPTMDPEGSLKEGVVDALCIGEGEEAMAELVDRGSPQGVRNMAYRKDDGVVIEPLRPFCDITRLPFKDYDIFDLQRMIDAKDGWVGLLTSRGCPFRCTYCLNHRIVSLYKSYGHLPKTYIRRHTVDQVVSEVLYLLENFKGIRMFIFDDDVFTFDKAWLREFSEKYREVTKVGFVCNAHVRMFDEEVASLLKEAGCKIVKFGLESGSERVRREILRRYMSNRRIQEAFSIAKRHGLHTSAFFMIGLPSETRQEMMDTIRLISKIEPGRFRISIFFPYKGTRAFDLAKTLNGIDEERMEALDNFFDGTCLLFGREESLLIEKLKTFFCLYVNAQRDLPHNPYRTLFEEVESADEAKWEERKEEFLARLKGIDEEVRHKEEFYTVRYERFMGVKNGWKDDDLSS
jgi:radical SAM superfamily enzyme YgiQ (UPF0313 family)